MGRSEHLNGDGETVFRHACALITTSNGKRVTIDRGHNPATNWRPVTGGV